MVSQAQDGVCYTHTQICVTHTHTHTDMRYTHTHTHTDMRYTHTHTHRYALHTHTHRMVCLTHTHTTQDTGAQTQMRRMRCREQRMGCVASSTDSALLSATQFMSLLAPSVAALQCAAVCVTVCYRVSLHYSWRSCRVATRAFGGCFAVCGCGAVCVAVC